MLVLSGCVEAQPGAPVPTAVEPSSSSAGSAVPVVIRGRGFAPAVTVAFGPGSRSEVDTAFVVRLGGVELDGVAYVDSQTLTATVPASLSAGRYDLEVVDPNRRSGRLAEAFALTACGQIALPVRETCANGSDEDCDGRADEDDCAADWWDCEYGARVPLEIDPAPLEADTGASVAVTIDHAALVSAGSSRADGADLRVVFSGPDGRREIDRVLDPESTWDTAATTLWFALQRDVPAGRIDSAYALYTGAPGAGAPMQDEAAVFWLADFFERPDDDHPGRGWELTEGSGDIDLTAGALRFTVTADTDNRPVADRPFSPITERAVWRFAFDWRRETTERNYRVHMQLGESAAMESPPPATDLLSNAGVGPSLVWSGPNDGMNDHEGFGYETGGSLSELATVSGRAAVEVTVEPATQTFDLTIDGVTVGAALPFTSERPALDRVRLFTWQLNENFFAEPRRFEYLILRPARAPEPVVTPGELEAGGC